MNAIVTSSLSKTYHGGLTGRDRVTALQDFSINVESGNVFGLLGPNGAGKTTFIKILLSIVHATSGNATMMGIDLPNVNIKKVIGYLPENHRFPGYLTGDQVLRFFGQMSEVPDPVLEKRIPELLALVGMSQWSKMKVKKYSKGMMQRLGLAQSLINDPKILFLDEPTDGVDPVGRKEIRDILKNLKQQGKTIFLNSHLLSEVELVSDRVAILDKGKLLKVGTVDEITTTTPQYRIGISASPQESFRVEAAAMAMKWSEQQSVILLETPSTVELNKMIDLLRKYNVEIHSVARERSSLEESFINLIKKEVAS